MHDVCTVNVAPVDAFQGIAAAPPTHCGQLCSSTAGQATGEIAIVDSTY